MIFKRFAGFALGLVSILSTVSIPSTGTAAERPNVVLIFADDK